MTRSAKASVDRKALAPAARKLPGLAKPALTLSLQFADSTHREQLTRHRVRRWLAAAVDTPAMFTVRIVDAEEGRALNQQYRGRDYATNVLTFAYEPEPSLAADLVLCAPVVAREAREQRIDLVAHYAHLLVHGALHARGYDHELGEDEAQRMEALESEILQRLGFADPYAPRKQRTTRVTTRGATAAPRRARNS